MRPRVVRHCLSKLAQWQQAHPRFKLVQATDVAHLQTLLGSYWGHFAHANSVRLRHLLFARQPWLDRYFTLQADGSLQAVQSARWQVRRRQAVRKILNFDGEPERNL